MTFLVWKLNLIALNDDDQSETDSRAFFMVIRIINYPSNDFRVSQIAWEL